jgi:mannosyltransferase
VRSPLPEFLWESSRWVAFGETIHDSELIWISALLILLMLWASITGGRRAVIPLLGVVVPVAAMYFAGATDPAFYKFLLMAVPFFVTWISGSAIQNRRGTVYQLVSGVLIAAVAAGMVMSLDNLYNDAAFARADYRGIAARITAEDDQNAGVILNAPNQWEVFTYYYPDGAPVYPLPKGQPDPAILEPQLEDISKRHDRLYVLYWGENQQDPGHVVERWLDTNTFRTSETWIGDVRLAIYAVPGDTGDAPQTELDADFEGLISLHGYTVVTDNVTPGDIIPVTLFWSANVPLDERYKVFLHLVDDLGAIVAQQDGEPVGGTSPTTFWVQDRIVVDNHGVLLPDDLVAGEYELLAGLYQLDGAGQRLQVRGAGEAEDYVSLGQVTVE